MNGLFFLLGGRCGGRGAVASIPSLVASCAPLLPPLRASDAALLPALGSPATPFLTAFCA